MAQKKKSTKPVTTASNFNPDQNLSDLLGLANKKIPIGVPSGYKVTRPIPASHLQEMTDLYGMIPTVSTTETTPLYFSGDQYNQAPSDPEKISALQNQLIASGLLDPKNLIHGQWDSRSAAAFEELLGISNAAGDDWQTTLTARINAANNGDLVTGKTRAPLVVKLANPDDLKITLQNVAQNLYGGNLSDGDVQSFINAYQSSQSQEQTQAYNAAGFNPETGQQDLNGGGSLGGTVTSPASPSGAAETFIRSAHPDQVAATQFGNNMDSILNTLRQSA